MLSDKKTNTVPNNISEKTFIQKKIVSKNLRRRYFK